MMNSITFLKAARAAISELEDAEQLEVLLALFDFAVGRNCADFQSPTSRAVYTLLQPAIDELRTRLEVA